VVNWLVKVAYNVCPTQIRKKRLADLPDAPEEPPRGPRDHSEAVWDCLNRLPLQYRRVLLLRFYHRLTREDIGILEFDQGDDTRSALGQRVLKIERKALAQLRLCLLKKGVDPDTWEIHPEDLPP
jgi:DNA-directed RNA polymerase specialized sigma24 family protein